MAFMLTHYSATAEDIAGAFLAFKEHVSNQATEIAALISELFAISSALLELDTAQKDNPFHRLRREVDADQRTLLLSLDFTFKDVKRLIGGLANPIYRTIRESYHGVWNAIVGHFIQQGNNHLLRRLEYYQQFLMDLSHVVQGFVSMHALLLVSAKLP